MTLRPIPGAPSGTTLMPYFKLVAAFIAALCVALIIAFAPPAPPSPPKHSDCWYQMQSAVRFQLPKTATASEISDAADSYCAMARTLSR